MSFSVYLTLPFFLKQAVLPVWDSKNSLKLLDKIQSSEETSLYEPKRPIDPKRNFLEKVTKYSWSTYCPPSLCIIWRKSLEQFVRKFKICKIHPGLHNLKQFIGLLAELIRYHVFNYLRILSGFYMVKETFLTFPKLHPSFFNSASVLLNF